MDQWIISIISFIITVYLQILGFVAKILFELLKIFGKLLGQGLNEAFKLTSTAISHKDILVLGAGETLKPRNTYRELFDYSQLANKQEASQFAIGTESDGDLWLGKYVYLKNNKATILHDLWLPNQFLYQHCLIIGLTGAGKTQFLLKSIGNLMTKGNLILVDAAGDLAQLLTPMAQKTGAKLGCWDISNSHQRVVWNFLEELEKVGQEKDIRAVAEAIYGEIKSNDPNAAFWYRDLKWLTAILALVVEARKKKIAQFDPSDLSALVGDREAVEALLAHLPNIANQWGSDLNDYLKISEHDLGREIGFLQTKLSPFKDNDVKRICDGKSTLFLLKELNSINGQNRYTLVIGQSLASGKFGSTLAGIMIRYITNVMYRRMNNRQVNWTSTYIICDEAPRLKNIEFKEFTAIGRNAKAGVILICQYIDDFSEQKDAINNCRTQILLQGVSQDSAEWFSKQLGEYQKRVIQLVNNGLAVGVGMDNQRNIAYEKASILGIKEITSRPQTFPSKRSAIVRINTADSQMTKPFLTDYCNDEY